MRLFGDKCLCSMSASGQSCSAAWLLWDAMVSLRRSLGTTAAKQRAAEADSWSSTSQRRLRQSSPNQPTLTNPNHEFTDHSAAAEEDPNEEMFLLLLFSAAQTQSLKKIVTLLWHVKDLQTSMKQNGERGRKNQETPGDLTKRTFVLKHLWQMWQ